MHASTSHKAAIYRLEGSDAPCFMHKIRICSNNSIRHGSSSTPFNSLQQETTLTHAETDHLSCSKKVRFCCFNSNLLLRVRDLLFANR
jgi:hypothetical protein